MRKKSLQKAISSVGLISPGSRYNQWRLNESDTEKVCIYSHLQESPSPLIVGGA